VSDRPSGKLDFKASPPYKILRTEGSSYVLNMPPEFQGKNLFHADVLRKWPNNPLPGQGTANPGPVEVEGSDEKEYELEEVLTSRTHYRKLQYQVRWKDWPLDGRWLPAGDLRNSPTLLKAFHERYPDRAGPPMRLEAWTQAHQDEVDLEPHPDDDRPAELATSRRSTRRPRPKR